MNTYNQLEISLSSHHEVFIDLIFSLGISAIEEKDNLIIVRSDDDLDNVIYGVESLAKSLKDIGIDTKFTYEQTTCLNKDWIDEYKNSINPVLVDNIYIHTTWQKPLEDKINIIIDPALAFGSGHHETTYMCLQLLQKYVFHGIDVFDVGCGSGILSIAAEKLGANVYACDTDGLAIERLDCNSKLNNSKIIKSWVGSISGSDKKYDVVVANIVADVIMILHQDLINSLKSNGVLILSGILDKYKDDVKSVFGDLKLVNEVVKNEWVSLVYKAENCNE